MRYAIMIENAGANFSACVPDLPGCVAMGGTVQEIEQAIREAIEFHLEGLRADGSPIPQPSSRVELSMLRWRRERGRGLGKHYESIGLTTARPPRLRTWV